MKYQVDTGSDSHLIPLNIFKILFPKAIIEQLAKHRYKRVVYEHRTKQTYLTHMCF